MNKRLRKLAADRQRLQEEIDSQRMELATLAERWRKPLGLIGVGLGVLGFLRHHRILVSGGLAALLSYRRKGLVGTVREWWRLLQLYSSPFSFVLKILFPPTHAQDEEGHTRADH